MLTSSPGFDIEEIETHMIEKQQRRIIVCGRFVPSDVAIKIRKKMNRRVEILEVQEVGDEMMNENEQTEQQQQQQEKGDFQRGPPSVPMVVYPGQDPSFHQPPMASMAYCRGGYSTSAMGVAEVWGNCEYAAEGEDDDDGEQLPWEERRGLEIPSWEGYLDEY